MREKKIRKTIRICWSNDKKKLHKDRYFDIWYFATVIFLLNGICIVQCDSFFLYSESLYNTASKSGRSPSLIQELFRCDNVPLYHTERGAPSHMAICCFYGRSHVLSTKSLYVNNIFYDLSKSLNLYMINNLLNKYF